MKILIVNDYGTPGGGAEHMSLTLRDGFRARGHDARLFASSARHPGLENAADFVCFGSESAARRVLQVANPSAVRSLRKALATFRPDVVHVRMFLTQLSPMILPLLRDVPSVLHVVNYQLICPTNTKLLMDGSTCHHRPGLACYREGCMPAAGVARTLVQGRMWRQWHDVFDLVVANSEWTRRRLQAENIDVRATIWNGVPASPVRPPLGGPPTVAYAGRLVGKKGVDVLMRAVAEVASVVPDVRLLVLGDGPDRAALAALGQSLGLGERLQMHGHRRRDEAEQVLAQAWVQAVPSVWEEPFGLVAAEAMMRGTAVVATDRGGLAEQVVHGETGFLVAPGDVSALAAALLRILHDRALAERMGAAGRVRALAEFREDLVIERFLRLYETLRPAVVGR